MPGPLLTLATVATCPHQGKATVVATNPRVLVMGQPVSTLPEITSVAGCPFQIPVVAGTKPQPCVTVQWKPAARIFVNVSTPVLLYDPSSAMCRSVEQIPQGPPLVSTIQSRVIGM